MSGLAHRKPYKANGATKREPDDKFRALVVARMNGQPWRLSTVCPGCGLFKWCAGPSRTSVRCVECTDERGD